MLVGGESAVGQDAFRGGEFVVEDDEDVAVVGQSGDDSVVVDEGQGGRSCGWGLAAVVAAGGRWGRRTATGCRCDGAVEGGAGVGEGLAGGQQVGPQSVVQIDTVHPVGGGAPAVGLGERGERNQRPGVVGEGLGERNRGGGQCFDRAPCAGGALMGVLGVVGLSPGFVRLLRQQLSMSLGSTYRSSACSLFSSFDGSRE
ncbi:hypothetical protein GCM10010232_50320 [Streptomyces amakusaensis]|uniref:Uncharacterized protein n=1 Tax=Streptomyces amakusaensis TaxID=67271 RepID=A0ABW0AM33_9ACTN